jgi:bacteriophage HK97-gp10 putative tail-component
MAITIKLKPGELPFRIKKNAQILKKVIKNGTRKAAEKSMRLLKSKTPVDTSRTQESWKVISDGDTYIVNNDSPIIGILDKGARPHNVNSAGVAAITAWCDRKNPGLSDKQLNNFVWAVITKIKQVGYEGKNFIDGTIDERRQILDIAMHQAIKEFESNQ